ncbi:MAG TPA: lysylphosphatidylglycerol synthase transmembrane domain-containing protein [Candidatus Saccharimonadales bacterium]|nr:lysylphosphatidylglycerol synthase transmembrane domain-containing protein [Candidatus Saccharimonadales bacterium]
MAARLRGGLGRGLLGLVISVAALTFVIRQVDLGRTAAILGSASLGWIAIMLTAQAVDLSLRAWRWQRLVAPIRFVRYVRMLEYLLIGYLANNVLPARLGELVRCHYLGDREHLSRTTTLGTVVVERVVDTAVVVTIASLAILVLHVRGLVASAVLVGLALTGLLVVALAFGLAAHRLPGADRVIAWARKWPRVGAIALKLRHGLAVAGRPRTLLEAVVLSFWAWGATVVAFAAAGQALGIQMTWAQASLLAAGVALATAIPSGPSNLGTFDLAAVEIASTFGVPTAAAFALALLAHASVLIMTSVGGAIALLRLGWSKRGEARVAATESAATESAGADVLPVDQVTPAEG